MLICGRITCGRCRELLMHNLRHPDAHVSWRLDWRKISSTLPVRAVRKVMRSFKLAAGLQTERTNRPLVSIVIPHFNRVELLVETLRSIEAQDYANWEAWVVDDGSAAQQWTVLQGMATERIHILQRTDGIKGPSRCRNLGAAEARGDYIVFLDSDDILAPWCLSQRMARVAEEPEADLWVFPVMLFKQQPGDL